MTLRALIGWVLDTNIFVVLGTLILLAFAGIVIVSIVDEVF